MAFGYDMSEVKKLRFAKAYPFERPEVTFRFNCGTGDIEDLDRWEDFAEREVGVERTAVIACGSNASPEQLARKFNGEEGYIPVVKAVLYDHDSVYCPLLASYGSLTATLAPSPGSELDCHVTLLTPRQLKIMNKTEGGYHLVKILNTKVILEGGTVLEAVHAYIHKKGFLIADGQPLSLKEQPCRKRKYTALTQPQALAHVARMLREEPGDDFVLSIICNAKQRLAWTDKIRQSALPYTGPLERVSECDDEASVVTW